VRGEVNRAVFTPDLEVGGYTVAHGKKVFSAPRAESPGIT
jgi:hypothetical protein